MSWLVCQSLLSRWAREQAKLFLRSWFSIISNNTGNSSLSNRKTFQRSFRLCFLIGHVKRFLFLYIWEKCRTEPWLLDHWIAVQQSECVKLIRTWCCSLSMVSKIDIVPHIISHGARPYRNVQIRLGKAYANERTLDEASEWTRCRCAWEAEKISREKMASLLDRASRIYTLKKNVNVFLHQ